MLPGDRAASPADPILDGRNGAARRAAYADRVGEFTRKLRAYRRVFRRAGAAGAPDLTAVLRRRPPTLFGVAAYELSVIASGRVDTRLKTLAALKASSRIGCPF